MMTLLYRVYAHPVTEGGKLVAVFPTTFPTTEGDPQTLAADAGAPLSAFVEQADFSGVRLRIFTPTREKGESDSAAVAALNALYAGGQIADVTEVAMGGATLGAQLCGGEWLLMQGTARAHQVDVDPALLTAAALSRPATDGTAWVATAAAEGQGRPNLALRLPGLAELDAYPPDEEAIRALGQATDTTGLIVYALGGPGREDVSFRAFGPLKGFLEDGASSNMLACLVGVLAARNELPQGAESLRAAQRKPGAPSRLTAQFVRREDAGAVWAEGVWVGGAALKLDPQS